MLRKLERFSSLSSSYRARLNNKCEYLDIESNEREREREREREKEREKEKEITKFSS